MNSQQPAANTSASLRPRNRRLISIEDDQNQESGSLSVRSANNTSGSSSSTSNSRAPSPIPAAHPSRATSTNKSTAQRVQNNSRSWGFQAPSTKTSNPLFAPGYWETSWSSIQGIASTLLGSDTNETPKSGIKTRRKPSVGHVPKFSLSTPDSWGPTAPAEPQLAYGSQEDRLARVQAKKREALLMANGHSAPDSKGQFKRRMSIDREAPKSPRDESEDALVYLHHVQKGDTLAGLSIRYDCSQPVLRKTNRLWPNDTIQIRRIAYIPVDACSVRGRKIPAPKASIDLLGDASNDVNNEDFLSTPTQASPDWSIPQKPTSDPSTALSPSPAPSTSQEPEVPYIHDSWVTIDHISDPVEIARLPRRTLGFFPPARRKSVTYSDTSPPRSPKLSSSTLSPPRSRQMPTGTHSESSAAASAAYFLKTLRGPGGVGSLDAKSSSPGPPRDKLNQMFAPHLPNVGVPRRASFESMTSTSSTGLGELGGKVEGWMRKNLTTKKTGRENGEGDLIELMESWDRGLGSSEEPGREREGTSLSGSRGGVVETSSRDQEERALTERFPRRGRVFDQQRKR